MNQVKYILSGLAHKVRGRLQKARGPEVRFAKKNRTAFENHFRALAERAAGEGTVRSYPSYLFLDPSSICNLKCPSCPTGIEKGYREAGHPVSFRSRTMLSVDLFDALIDEMGEYLFMIMFYNWGEPLLNRNLPYFLRRAKALDIYTDVHSNFSMKIPDDYLHELLESGIDSLCASIDGFSQESYGTYRVGGDLALAKENLLRFAAARDRLRLPVKIYWNYLVFSFNEHEVGAASRFCKDHGILFRRKDACINAEANPDWVPGYRKILSTLRPQKKPAASTAPAQATAQAPAQESGPPPAPPRSSCGWHYGYSSVNPNGSVSPCCAPWEQAHDFGTVIPGERRFADVWNNDMFRKARAVLKGEGASILPGIDTICERCPFGGVKDLLADCDRAVSARARELFDNSDLARMRGQG